jgi:CheY-like chemotaxis protein
MVEDDGDIRRINTQVLTQSGFQVDAAEDGAVAWDTLQRNRYDLMVTDNDMPKVTGLELLHKLHAARMALPVIMATGQEPRELTLCPWLQPAALLIKPYTFAELLGTVKNVLRVAVSILLVQLCLTGVSLAQETKPALISPPSSPDSVIQPSAMTLSVVGKCQFSEDGVNFTNLEKGHVFEQGAIVRTGDGARTDLFFRRTGTTIRLQAGTEIKIEKMTLTMKDGLPIVLTLLDLRAGRIFTVVRSEVAGSTLEIRNAAGRSVVEGSGIGRYIITADGTHVAAAGSVIPLKVIGENGITVISAGQQFDKKDGKPLAASPPLWVKDMIELDELQAATEEPAAPKPSLKP